MTTNNNSEDKVNKIVPSKLETAFQKFLYRTIGKRIPQNVTPNQITLLGAIGGLIGIICAFLSVISPFFLIGSILGLISHLICDDLDGYVARTRNMSSKSGAYFDLLTDILHITFLIIGLAFSGVISFQIAVFMVPVYALMMFTSMNYILYLKEFLFPRLGPIETHMFFAALCVSGIVFKGKPLFCVKDFPVKCGDIICFVGCILMYFEMIRLEIQLFNRLKKVDKKDRDNEE